MDEPKAIINFSQNPHLAVLEVLKTTLETAEPVLLAASPSFSDDDSEWPHSEAEAYIDAIFFQLAALQGTLDCYHKGLKRALRLSPRHLKNCDAEDIPF